MSNLRSKNGITIVALAITIIILLILSSIGMYMGINAMSNANDSKLVSELGIVQHAILEQYTKYTLTKDNTTLVGLKLENTEVEQIATKLGITLVTIPEIVENADYYRLDKAALLAIGIENSSDEYIINYQSGEVINITKEKTSKGIPLYTKANSFNANN